jgi:hypothetical protein
MGGIFDDMTKRRPEVLVVHCVDTEGPIGGNVRRRPDGSQEFMGTWREIKSSIARLTSAEFRHRGADSYGKPYVYNWFIMDFTGFRTNPKKRVTTYNDTYDHFKSFSTTPDAFYWHYHHPSASGVGDEWSHTWDSSSEYMNILLHRLVERHDFPEAYRAGGTIEDNKASLWLEDNIMIDYSNRVSAGTKPTKNIFDFNWHGAPRTWGYYHPSPKNLLRRGNMRRYIVRSVDLWSRIHVLSVAEVREAFTQAADTNQPVILSFFSHDHREMYNETVYAIAMLHQVATETGVPWRTIHALPAVQRCEGMRPQRVRVSGRRSKDTLQLSLSSPSYQRHPFIGARLGDGSLRWLASEVQSPRRISVSLEPTVQEVTIGGTSMTGNTFVATFEI